MKILSTFAATLTVAGLLGSTALAQETNLRIQTHHGQESPANINRDVLFFICRQIS